jgi:phosphoribosylformylglycinamidine synthase
MKNDYGRGAAKISVPPTLLVTVVGKLPDVRQAVTMDAKAVGDIVYVLGETRNEAGASEYYAHIGILGANVPRVDFAARAADYKALHGAMRKGLVRSAHDCSDGGLFVALAETAMAGRLGIEVDLQSVTDENLSDPALLFSESQGRLVLTVSPSQSKDFEAAMAGHPCFRIGTVVSNQTVTVTRGGRELLSLSLDELFTAWRKPLDF